MSDNRIHIVVREETAEERHHRQQTEYNLKAFAKQLSGDFGNITRSPKKKWVCVLLWLFLGFFGAHRFYVGKKGTAIAMLLTYGFFGFGWFYDGLCLWGNSFTDANGKNILGKYDKTSAEMKKDFERQLYGRY